MPSYKVQPRVFSDEGYEIVDDSSVVEEEAMPYEREAFYPARNGEIIHGRYQIGAKLGYGTSSTVWLAQDLWDGTYWAMKIQVLLALNYIHTTDVIYTDLHADNLLIGMADPSVFDKLVNLEAKTPSRRKYVDGTVIHTSLGVVQGIGPLMLCDMGQARIGHLHEGIAMPAPFRAPEVILKMPWDYKIDMWNVGVLAWNLLEGDVLFKLKTNENQEQSNARHLASIISLIGPPPAAFLSRFPEATAKYWDSQGNWLGPPAVAVGHSFESLATKLDGDEKAAFVDFMRSLLRWLPEDRLGSAMAFHHPWVQTGGTQKKNES
ncbi:protein kinase-like protein [Niveomyces insectorum RCEF 264]|uniref:Protein kinase-like protein n=1 Tax=Niveomyces insectorum RCEF 264 TaxID=1081102 RepID=A0A167QUX7_9HYPO|nr:protein kinase-like protein [Niveomyces insectorum RCEF 264]